MEVRESYIVENRGQKIFGMLHRPRFQSSFPIVVFLHGFAGHKIGNQRLYVALAKMLALQGIGALRFDFRGCGDSEGEFCDLTLSGELEDAQIIWDSVKKLDGVLGRPLGILGVSLGGMVAVQLASQNADCHSLALWAPVACGQQWSRDWKEYFPQEAAMGAPKMLGETVHAQFVEEFLSLSLKEPLRLLSQIPLLHIQGSQDTNVRPVHAKLYQDWREGAEAETLFKTIETCGHDFAVAQERVLQETCEWFKRTLLSKPEAIIHERF